jgi:hypothetical protein
MSIWGIVVRYQARGGTSRGNLVVLQGAFNSALEFLARMPPSTVSGKVTRAQIKMMMTMVPKESVAVER